MTSALRLARPSDLDALCRLETVCFDADRFSRRQLAHLLRGANAITWLAVNDDDQPVGYGTLLFRRNSRTARLYSFCVEPQGRGEGLGRRLLETLEGEASKRHLDQMTLEVRADNRVAIGLYRRMGFTLQRWIDDYYADGCAAWQMAKPLHKASPPLATPLAVT